MTVEAMPDETSPISFRFSLLPYSRPEQKKNKIFDKNLINKKIYNFKTYFNSVLIIYTINKNFYGLAIYRMFSIASQIAINFGYKNVHHIEYDCELMDKYLILENVNSLETHDSVIYTDNGNEDGFLFGSFKSFKVESLPDRFKNYNPEFMVDEMRKIKPRHLEFFTKKIFMDSGKVLFGLPPSEVRFKRGLNFYNRNVHYTLFYNSNDGTLNIFYKSEKKI